MAQLNYGKTTKNSSPRDRGQIQKRQNGREGDPQAPQKTQEDYRPLSHVRARAKRLGSEVACGQKEVKEIRPMKEHFRRHAAAYGWAGLIGYVIAWDSLAPDTLSNGFDRLLEKPVGKYIAMLAVAGMGMHLLNLNEHFGTPDLVNISWKAVHGKRTTPSVSQS